MISDSELLLLCIVIMREQHCWTKNILQALIGRPYQSIWSEREGPLLWVFDRQYTNLLSPVHTSDISTSTRSIRKQSMTSLLLDLRRQNKTPFVLLLAYTWTMTILMSQAWLHSFVSLPFVFPLCLCYRVNPGFNRFSTYKLPSNSA